jgi:hypothetical protein
LYSTDVDRDSSVNWVGPQHLGGFRSKHVADGICITAHNGRGLGIEVAGKIYVIIFGQPDSNGPHVCNVMTIRGVGIEMSSDFESNLVEAEFAVSSLENFPALIWRGGSSQVSTKRAELKFGVQCAPEVSGENQAAGHFKFRISKVMNANQNSRAEENDDHSSKALVCKALEEGESRAKPANYIYKQGNPAGREPTRQQFVVDVATIGSEDWLVSQETPDDGEASIQDWNRERDQRRGHAHDRGGFLAPENAVTAQKETDKKAARVAQENGGRIEVETQNPQESSR